MADNICVIPFKGRDYPFNPRDVTLNKLRSFKSQFGDEYGRYASFINLFLSGDADAIACVLSIVIEKVDGKKRPPDAIDFAPYDLFEAIRKANDARVEGDVEDEDEDDESDDPFEQPVSTGDAEPETIPAGTLT